MILVVPPILLNPSQQRNNINSNNNNNNNNKDQDDDLSKTITVEQGASVQLHCPVSGYPLPRITWLQLLYNVETNDFNELVLPENKTKLVSHSKL